MGKKSDRQAARIAAARWREFCDSWVAIGQAADRELRTLESRLTSEERASVRRQAVELEDKADGLADYDTRVQELRRDLGTPSGVSVFRHAKQIVAERYAARAEVERLKERCARDDAGVTIHACPPKGEGMMPCCDRPPFEVMGDRMTTNSALVNCDRVRLQTERAALAQENARLTERLRMMQHGEAEALKMMAAEKQRADVLAEGVRLWKEAARLYNDPAPYRDAVTWLRMHGHLVGDGK